MTPSTTATANAGETRSGFVPVEGARLWYDEVGAGPPLVLLHAGLGDSRMWDPQVVTFAPTHRVIRYDARGFGRSDPARGAYSARADLVGLLDGLGVGQAHLVGISMGGAVALDAALEFPERVASLVLASARPSGLAPSTALRDGWAAVDEAVEAGDLAVANELELRMWVDGPRRQPGAVDPAVRALVGEMNAVLLAGPDEGEPRPLDPPAVGRLGEIAAPTLVIVGEHDQPDVVAGGELLAAGIPDARLGVVAGTAHLPNLERPDEFNRLIAGFLDEVGTGR